MDDRPAREASPGVTETLPESQQATDAEVSLLGAAMSGYPDLDELADIVDPADFYAPSREAVWSAILRVHRAGNQPDPISVRVALDETREKHDPLELLRYAQMCPVVASAPFYAHQVAKAAGMRAIQHAGVKVTQLGSTVTDDLDDLRERARAAVDEACSGKSTTTRARTLADALPAVLDIAQNGQDAVLGTGWADVDRLIGGLAPGRLIVIGARPGVGKSLMLTNLALHMTHWHKHAALLASLEMPETEVIQRLLATFARADLTRLQHGRTEDTEWERIAEKHADLETLPLTLDDAPSQSVTHIRRRARDIQRHRDDLALIAVDYLQLVEPRDTRANTSRAEQLGQVSRDLKLLARETGACVVAAAQVNRDSAKRNDRPRMSDLRESGAIEADADQVILLHQPDDEIPEVEVIVDKNRHGPKGVATLRILGHYARLASTEWKPTDVVGRRA